MAVTNAVTLVTFIRLSFYILAILLIAVNGVLTVLEVIRSRRIQKERYEKRNIKRLRP